MTRNSSKWRGRIWIVALAALAVIAGGGAVAVGYYYKDGDQVRPENFANARVTLIMASDGTTQLAQLGAEWGLRTKEGDPAGKATGNVVNYVYQELKDLGVSPSELKSGGYKVTTTIDPQAQELLERAARPDLVGSQLYGRQLVKSPDGRIQQDLESAGVVIDHTTGRVLAYYGGLDATAVDLAGLNQDGSGMFGGHPPGASMEIYTLAAVLDAGASLKSRWKALPFTTDDGIAVGNNGAPNVSCRDSCPLEYSFMKGYQVPFYWAARMIGPGLVVQTAQRAGVRHLWDNNGRAHELKADLQEPQSRSPFDRHIGYGQYPITALDHATGVGTIANGGVYNKPHFVVKLERLDLLTGLYRPVAGVREKLAPQQVIRKAVANDVTYAMRQAAIDRKWPVAQGGRDIATAAGVWPGTILKAGRPTPSSSNCDAWVVGFTGQFSVAIWTGNAASSHPVTDPVTTKTITAGTTPYRIWSSFVSSYSGAKKYPMKALPDPSHIGDDRFRGANGVP